MSGAKYEYYFIIEVDGVIKSVISKGNKPDRYGDPKKFGSLKVAKDWVIKHSYKGMSHYYKIMAVPYGNEIPECLYNQKEEKKKSE